MMSGAFSYIRTFDELSLQAPGSEAPYAADRHPIIVGSGGTNAYWGIVYRDSRVPGQ